MINKMDYIDDKEKNQRFNEIKKLFESKENNSQIIFLPTSIWDITLYKAWGNIISDLIPKSDKIKELMKKFVTACRADEAVLLEKNTLIKISSYNNKDLKDNERFVKMTEIIKKLKYTCKLESKSFNDIFIKTINNIIYLTEFENSMYIIVAFSNKNTSLELVKINIEICKKTFKELFLNE